MEKASEEVGRRGPFYLKIEEGWGGRSGRGCLCEGSG